MRRRLYRYLESLDPRMGRYQSWAGTLYAECAAQLLSRLDRRLPVYRQRTYGPVTIGKWRWTLIRTRAGFGPPPNHQWPNDPMLKL